MARSVTLMFASTAIHVLSTFPASRPCLGGAGDEHCAGRKLLQEGNGKGTTSPSTGKGNGEGNGGCDGSVCIVKAGDTLSELANKALEVKAKCSVQKIAQANRIQDVNRITIGERLCLPTGWTKIHTPQHRMAQALKYEDDMHVCSNQV
ncbi:hypothetical protein ABBQ32_007912 [Trebouxia sp. C0010 RCD-2024]